MSVSVSLKYKALSLGTLLLCSGILVFFRVYVLKTGQGGTACAVLTAFACLLLTVLSLFVGKSCSRKLTHGLPSVTFGASVTGFLLLSVLIVSIHSTYFASPELRVTDGNAVISLLLKGFTLLSAVYFLMTAASMKLPQKKALHLLFAIMPVLFYAFLILNEFINNRTMPLAESGGYHMLGMIFTMLYFLCEGKLLIGTGNTVLFLATGQTAFLLCAVYNIPALVQVLQGGSSQLQLVYSLMTLAVMIYLFTRMASLRPASKAPVSSEAEPV